MSDLTISRAMTPIAGEIKFEKSFFDNFETPLKKIGEIVTKALNSIGITTNRFRYENKLKFQVTSVGSQASGSSFRVFNEMRAKTNLVALDVLNGNRVQTIFAKREDVHNLFGAPERIVKQATRNDPTESDEIVYHVSDLELSKSSAGIENAEAVTKSYLAKLGLTDTISTPRILLSDAVAYVKTNSQRLTETQVAKLATLVEGDEGTKDFLLNLLRSESLSAKASQSSVNLSEGDDGSVEYLDGEGVNVSPDIEYLDNDLSPAALPVKPSIVPAQRAPSPDAAAALKLFSDEAEAGVLRFEGIEQRIAALDLKNSLVQNEGRVDA